MAMKIAIGGNGDRFKRFRRMEMRRLVLGDFLSGESQMMIVAQ